MVDSTDALTCTADCEGRLCGKPSVDGAPFPICLLHVQQAYRFVTQSITSFNRTGCITDEQATANALAAQAYLGVVYYVRVGDQIKIGTTRQEVRQRLSDLPPDRQVLATEPGDEVLERARHRQFKVERIAINREWFRPSGRLWEHIAAVREQYGPPRDDLFSQAS